MKKHYLPILFFLAIMPIFFIGLDRDKSVLPSPLIGKKIPEFSLPSLINSELQIDSSELLNNTFLFNVWATWCVGCLEEHDFLMKLSESNEIPIVGLNWRDNHNDALSLIGSIGAALTLSTKNNSILLSLLVLPVTIPILIFGAKTVVLYQNGHTSLSGFYFIGAYCMFALSFSPFVSAAALRIGSE